MRERSNRGANICSPCVTLEEPPRRKAKENVNGMGMAKYQVILRTYDIERNSWISSFSISGERKQFFTG